MWQQDGVGAINGIQVLVQGRKDGHHPFPIGNLHHVVMVGLHFTTLRTYWGRLVRLRVPTLSVVEQAENENCE